MKTLSESAKAAKLIRAELKKNGIKASVKSKTYSGGSSVSITITDETPETADKIQSAFKKYQYGHFDGMTDCYEYSNSRDDIPQTSHIFVNREFSKELEEKAQEYITERFYTARSVLCGCDLFWTANKPRKRG